ncbi:hypothetical protein CTI12_AA166790 [Artemisia annua]|uniref:Uncharacterized protein n=1 Tax=Artemisia annua TaxID=35608 RepID=A0A2U1MWV0_ARTAN|nr:hypothetical protein CTI12_AA166790 [Artemisia annua]
MPPACATTRILILFIIIILVNSLPFSHANELPTNEPMVPLIEPEKIMGLVLNDSRRKLGGFQICSLCTCCSGGAAGGDYFITSDDSNVWLSCFVCICLTLMEEVMEIFAVSNCIGVCNLLGMWVQSSLPRNHRFRAKMVGMLHLVKEIMLLDTLRRDVVGMEVDNSNDGATGASRISQSNEENVVDLQLALWNDVDKKHVGSEMFDKKWTKRDKKIDLGENLTIYSKNVVGDEVKNIGDWLSWPTYVEGEASKGWFLQMTDSLDKIDKVFNQLMHIEFVPM